MKYHPVLLGFTAILISVAGTLLLLEIGLRFLPVRSAIPVMPVTAEGPVLHYKGNHKQTYSAGWNFDAVNKSRTNAQGYLSDFDYEVDNTEPLIAVVGDSFIEARMVPFRETVQERIRKELDDRYRVYNFAAGGSPLSQYLIFARHAHEVYGADFLIINIVSNDFDESLPKYKNAPRFHYFEEGEDKALKPLLTNEYSPSVVRRIIASSALVRYLHFNLSLQNTVNDVLFKFRSKDKTQSQGSTDAPQKTNIRIEDSKKAVDVFLKLLPDYSGLPRSRILLVIDGQRFAIYNDSTEKAKDSYFGRMREYMIGQARAAGYEIIDMQPAFEKDYAENNLKFEYEKDGHWNSHAHKVVAEEILKSRGLKSFARP